MKGCTRARAWLLAEVDGELSLEQRLQLDAHLERCAACRAERGMLAAIERELAGLPEPPVESLDLERAVSAVRARIARPAGDGGEQELLAVPAARAGAPRRWRAAAAAAGLLAAVAALLVFAAGRRDPPASGAPVAASAPDAASPAQTASATDATVAAAEGGDALDQARLDAARAAVGERLSAAFAGVPLLAGRAEVEAAALRFEADTAELARGDWPLLRLAQFLAGHQDDALAGAALRYLGVRGDPIATGALRGALERPALAPAAVAALGDLGAEGLPGLAEALNRPELCALAVERVAAVGGAPTAPVLAQALERRARARRSDALDAQDAALLAALAAVRPCPVVELFGLAQRGFVPRADVLDALAGADGARDALGALAEAGGAQVDTELLLEALARLRPPEALPFVEEQATLRRTRDAAHDCLAAYADAEALDVLVRLRSSGRARAELVLDASERLLAARPEAAVDLARRATVRGDAAASSELLDLLLAVGTRGAAPGLAELVFAPPLTDEERPWAALALGEVGDAASAGALARGLARLAPGEERLAAACLLALSALGSRDAALAALAGQGGLEPRLARRLAELCDEAGRDGTRVVTLHRVARELETVLEDRSRAPAAGTP